MLALGSAEWEEAFPPLVETPGKTTPPLEIEECLFPLLQDNPLELGWRMEEEPFSPKNQMKVGNRQKKEEISVLRVIEGMVPLLGEFEVQMNPFAL